MVTKVFFFHQCSKMQFITFQNFHIQTCFCQFLCFFSLKCWFKGQMMSRIHLSLPNVYKLMYFDRNINGNRDVKFLECDKWSLHWYKNLTLQSTVCWELTLIQVNLFQKHLFLNLLTHNMATDCSFIPEFSTRKIQAENMMCTNIVLKTKTKTENNVCTQHLLKLYFSCTEVGNRWTICCHIVG